MRKASLLAASSVAIGIGMLAVPGVAAAAESTSYQANLQPVALNTPAGAASGQLMLSLNGDQATITETVKGLAATLPTDTATLDSLGIPAAFAGKPFPHVQHIHINGGSGCPTSAADGNKDGLITVTEAAGNYGPIGTTLSVSGDTSPNSAADVTIAPSGAGFTYKRTITLDQATLSAVKAGKAEIVVHGLNPSNAPKASLTTPNSLGVTLPGASKQVAAIATAPALCGELNASQMSSVPSGAAATGGGSTAGLQHEGLIAGGAAVVAAGAIAGGFALRRRTSTES